MARDPHVDVARARLDAGASGTTRRRLWALLVAGFAAALTGVTIDLLQRLEVLAPSGVVPRLLAAVATGLGGGAAVYAALERRTRAVSRRTGPLLLLALGLAVVFGGQVVGYVATASWPGPFVVWVEAAPVAVGLPIAGLAVVLLTWPPGMTRRDIALVAADGLVAAMSLMLVWRLVVLPAWQPVESEFDVPFATVDPWIQFVVVLSLVIAAAASRRTGSLPLRQLVPLQAGLLVYVASDITGDVLALADRSSVITWSIVGYLLAVVLVVAFAVRPALEADPPSALWWRDLWSLLVPFGTVLVAAVVTVALRAADQLEAVGAAPWLAVTVVVVLGVTLAIRLLLVSDLYRVGTRRVERDLRDATQDEWFAALIGDSRDLISVLDRDGRIIYQTPSLTPVLGYLPGSLDGQSFARLLPDRSDEDVHRVLSESAHRVGAVEPVDVVVMDALGLRHDAELTVAPLRTGGADGFVVTLRDVTDHRRLRAEASAAGRRDALTGLPNREGFLSQLHDELATAELGEFAVVVFDLQGFRAVNDGHGHRVGDLLLQRVAEAMDRLPETVLAMGRVGGDEFALAVADDQVEAEVGQVERELRSSLSDVLLPDGGRVTLPLALGYCVRGQDDATAAELLEAADLAMASASTGSSGGTLRYEPALRATLVRRLRAEADLLEALDEDRLVVHYQPIVRLSSGEMSAVEALVRLRGQDGALVPPADFLPAAEDLGLMPRIGRHVLRTALSDLPRIREANGRPVVVSVNVSASELVDTFTHDVAEALSRNPGAGPSLVLELTETVVAANRQLATRLLSEVRDLGVGVALDDFGTGYSSLSYVSTLPLDYLKIDASFIRRLGSSRESQAMVRTIIQLGLNLGLMTVAEGLETVEQVDLVRGMGCDRGQGFLFARPMPADDLVALLRTAEGGLRLRGR